MITVQGAVVRYGEVRALDGLSLEVPKGCLFGLLGPNGAGKSTTIACIAGLLKPSEGRVVVDGVPVFEDPDRARRLIGLVPQSLALFRDLSVAENLATFAGIFGVPRALHRPRIEWGLELARLGPKRHTRVEHLSGGMARRLNLACGLLHDPQIVICDEPTTGVDPQSRNHIFETLRTLHREGRTIIYTTHYMEEVEALCERVAIVDHGKVIAHDTLPRLLAGGDDHQRFEVELTAESGLKALTQALHDAQLEVRSVCKTPRSLEDVFLDLTGRALREGSAAVEAGAPEVVS